MNFLEKLKGKCNKNEEVEVVVNQPEEVGIARCIIDSSEVPHRAQIHEPVLFPLIASTEKEFPQMGEILCNQEILDYNLSMFNIDTNSDNLTNIYVTQEYENAMLDLYGKLYGGSYNAVTKLDEIFDTQYICKELITKTMLSDNIDLNDYPNEIIVDMLLNITKLFEFGVTDFVKRNFKFNDDSFPCVFIDISDELPFVYIAKYSYIATGFKMTIEKLSKEDLLNMGVFRDEMNIEFNETLKEFISKYNIYYMHLITILDHLSKGIVFNYITKRVYTPFSKYSNPDYSNEDVRNTYEYLESSSVRLFLNVE